MNLNFNFSKIGNLPDDYLVLISLGKITFNRSSQVPLRDVFLINTTDPLVEISNSFSIDKIKILQIPDHQTSHFRTGMVFNSKGGNYNLEYSNSRNQNLEIRTVSLNNNEHYFTKGFNKQMAKTIVPEYIRIFNKNNNYDSSFYMGNDLESNTKIIIPNSLILRYFYYLDDALSLLLLNRKFDKIVHCSLKKEKYNLVFKDEKIIDDYLLQQHAKYLFINGKNSNRTDIQIAINSYYRDLFNSNGDKTKEPNDISIKIPFQNSIKFNLKGEMISKNKFLAYDIESITPNNSNENLFSTDAIYMVDLSDNMDLKLKINCQYDNEKLKIILDRQGVVDKNQIENTAPSNRFLETPICHTIKPTNIDFILFKDLFDANHQSNTYKNIDLNYSDITLLNSDHHHFNLTQKALSTISTKYKYLTIENSDNEPFSLIPFPKKIPSKINIWIKMLLIKITYKGIEYILLDSGAEFPIWVIRNDGKSIRNKNSKRLTDVIFHILDHYSLYWKEQYISEYTFILNKFKFTLLKPIYLSSNLSDEEKINQFKSSIMIRLLQNTNDLIYK